MASELEYVMIFIFVLVDKPFHGGGRRFLDDRHG